MNAAIKDNNCLVKKPANPHLLSLIGHILKVFLKVIFDENGRLLKIYGKLIVKAYPEYLDQYNSLLFVKMNC